jgi:hypothetical protein
MAYDAGVALSGAGLLVAGGMAQITTDAPFAQGSGILAIIGGCAFIGVWVYRQILQVRKETIPEEIDRLKDRIASLEHENNVLKGEANRASAENTRLTRQLEIMRERTPYQTTGMTPVPLPPSELLTLTKRE